MQYVRTQYAERTVSKRAVRLSDLGLRFSFGPWTGLIKKKTVRSPKQSLLATALLLNQIFSSRRDNTAKHHEQQQHHHESNGSTLYLVHNSKVAFSSSIVI
jgi:hypothetical protein